MSDHGADSCRGGTRSGHEAREWRKSSLTLQGATPSRREAPRGEAALGGTGACVAWAPAGVGTDGTESDPCSQKREGKPRKSAKRFCCHERQIRRDHVPRNRKGDGGRLGRPAVYSNSLSISPAGPPLLGHARRMRRAGASKNLNKSPCSSRAAWRSRCGHCASFYIEERFVDSMTSARYLTGRHARDRDCRPGHARGPGQQGRPGRGNAQAVTVTGPGSRHHDSA